jgi:hypothetical protein
MRRSGTALALGIMLAMSTRLSGAPGSTERAVHSPDGRIVVRFEVRDGVPLYGIERLGRTVVRPSLLGFRFTEGPALDSGLALENAAERPVDETWRPVWGKSSFVRSRSNEMTVTLREASSPSRVMRIVFRVFDDGVGFRYELPEQPNLRDVEIAAEETEFRMAGDHTAWWIPGDYDSYEHLYRETPIDEIGAANTPLTMRTADGLYISIHEANLTDYAGMTLAWVEGDPQALRCELVPWPDGVKVRGTTPLVSPWRTIQIGETPGDLVESHLILNLNEPCALDDTSWIQPMKYIGIWWGMHIGKYTWSLGPDHGATTANAKRYIDFAAEHGIPAVLIEGWNTGWDRWGAFGAFDFVTPYTDFDLPAVVRYGRDHGVFLIGHHETGGDVPGYEEHLEEAFSLYERLGVPAVKTGYAGGIYPRGQHHHGQWMVRHYRRVLEAAAAHHLMLDVHEPIAPTGIERTYPNMMTREGVRGTEYNAWSEGNPPEHTTILPFTRMLAGPIDYTPGIFDLTFDEYRPRNRVRTTLANQLALYVVIESPLQMAADLIENYEGNPAFRFIEDVPCTWDETLVPEAEIGDYTVFARRSGVDWYLGAVTDENARVLSVPLSFLAPGVVYVAEYYRDGPDADWLTAPTSIEIGRELVDQTTWLSLALGPGGGAAYRLTPATDEDRRTIERHAPPF